jgi:alcohol dehydrogenase YqhD (iron-dependent ADH family)
MQFANRVFDMHTITLSIDLFKQFLKDIGMPTTLREIGIKDETRFDEIAKKCVRGMQSGTTGNFIRLSPVDIVYILKLAY